MTSNVNGFHDSDDPDLETSKYMYNVCYIYLRRVWEYFQYDGLLLLQMYVFLYRCTVFLLSGVFFSAGRRGSMSLSGSTASINTSHR